MSSETDSDEIPVIVVSEDEPAMDDPPEEAVSSSQSRINELLKLLELERQKSSEYEEKFKHALADSQNLSRQTNLYIKNAVNAEIIKFILDFLEIYDDFDRAKSVLSKNKINVEGLGSILKNMDLLLKKYDVTSIEVLGEIFDPNSHEAISVVTDSSLDENTITKELRKGYIFHERVIRPVLVEVSKKE